MIIQYMSNGALLQDNSSLLWQRSADTNLSKLDDLAYVRGGAEYYASLVRRNMALRELLGTDGPSVYTSLGNDEVNAWETYLLSTPR